MTQAELNKIPELPLFTKTLEEREGKKLWVARSGPGMRVMADMSYVEDQLGQYWSVGKIDGKLVKTRVLGR